MKRFLTSLLQGGWVKHGRVTFPVLVVGLFSAMAAVGTGTVAADSAIIMQPSPTAGSCGSSQNIEVAVKDANGNPAPNGTMVTFTTTFGSITSPVGTTAGLATARFVLPLEARATAQLTASALGATSQRSFSVLCDSNEYGPAATGGQTASPGPQTPAPPAGGGAASLSIQARNFAYTPTSLTVQAGQQVTLGVSNVGPAPHTFTITGVTDTSSIASGASKTVQFSVAQPGSLTFFCTIHGASVMSGTLNVTPAGGQTTAAPAMPAAPTAPMAPPPTGGYGY